MYRRVLTFCTVGVARVGHPTTIGVSIPIPPQHGALLQERHAGFGDLSGWQAPAHITLRPPTVVDDGTHAAFREHRAKVAAAHAPFRVVLRGTGTFLPVSDVVFIQVAQGVSACEG